MTDKHGDDERDRHRPSESGECSRTFFNGLLRPWILSGAVWGALGILFTAYVTLAYGPTQQSVGSILAAQLVLWGTYIPLTPPTFRWGRRLSERTRRRWVSLGAGFGWAVVFVLAHVLLRTIGTVVFELSERNFGDYFVRSLRWAPWDFVMFLVIAGCGHALGSRERLLSREREAEELRSRLVEAQLSALKMQLQPHFLFNTLHAIGVYTRKDPEEARRMIALLGDLLRQSLQNPERQEVRLEAELAILGTYLKIQEIRFQDRLAVVFDVDPAATSCWVPNLLLQPLVENAVRHGVEASSGKGTIEVRVLLDDPWLDVEVRDDGPGLEGAHREGVGLGNTRARLAKLYGDRQSLTLERAPQGGLAVKVRVPLRSDADA